MCKNIIWHMTEALSMTTARRMGRGSGKGSTAYKVGCATMVISCDTPNSFTMCMFSKPPKSKMIINVVQTHLRQNYVDEGDLIALCENRFTKFKITVWLIFMEKKRICCD
jgi:hypothetical protein